MEAEQVQALGLYGLCAVLGFIWAAAQLSQLYAAALMFALVVAGVTVGGRFALAFEAPPGGDDRRVWSPVHRRYKTDEELRLMDRVAWTLASRWPRAPSWPRSRQPD